MKVLVRERIADAGIELLRAKFDVDVDESSPLEDVIGGYDAIVIRSATKLTAELIEKGTRLRVIGRAGVGVDNVDVDAATRRGIVVANAPGANVVSAAEHTIGLLLALARNIPQAHAALREGRWERGRWGGVELSLINTVPSAMAASSWPARCSACSGSAASAARSHAARSHSR